MTYTVSVQNVKCGGCATNIKNGLANMTGIENVEVDISTGQVRFDSSDGAVADVKARLGELGYPAKDGSKAGLGGRLKMLFTGN